MSLKNSILFTLADGRPHNPAEICHQLSIPQADLQAIIDEFGEEGLVLEVSSNGKLSWPGSFHPLSEAEIRQQLSQEVNQQLERFEMHYSLESTNDFLMNQTDLSPCVCLAEQQTLGKGRNGRAWISPTGQNIYLSISWYFDPVPERIQLLSLLSAIAVTRSLRQQDYPSVAVKWPNDIYLGDKKLGGILLETRSAGSKGLQVVIGIGLNIAMQNPVEMIDQPWTALVEVDPDAARHRNRIVAALLEEITRVLTDFSHACSRLDSNWPEFDMTLGRQVRVITASDSLTGEGAGIDAEGHFRLATCLGIKSFSSADISLRLH